MDKEPFRMDFDISTIKHLGLQMYSTLPPVIGELVANAWDANATKVEITIPEGPLDSEDSEIVIKDNGIGMSDEDIRQKYLIVGRDRRKQEPSDRTPPPLSRRVMGRKGIGKFSAFGIAAEIEIESVADNDASRFVMNYARMLDAASERRISFPAESPSGRISGGTAITLRHLTKYRSRGIPLRTLRRGLARRFAIVGEQARFSITVNGDPITVEERDLQRLLDRDAEGTPYLWTFEEEEIAPNTDLTISGWIGSLPRTTPELDGVDRGISIMARGKMVQEPFLFHAVVGQQYALSYLVGELHAEFVDDAEDTIGTSRNTLVWDTEANGRLMEWGKRTLNKIAREWARRRSEDRSRLVKESTAYREFKERARNNRDDRAMTLADRLVSQTISKNLTSDDQEVERTIESALNFLEFNSFAAITKDLVEADLADVHKIIDLFQQWEVVEAMEMSRVTKGRVETIAKLQALIEGEDTLEVPTLHRFLRDFPWVIDPRWSLVGDEVRYSSLLRKMFPEAPDRPEVDRRIDFLCVQERDTLIVVEIKRPKYRASEKDLKQLEDYVLFMRDQVEQTNEPEWSARTVVGYLLCGAVVKDGIVRQRMESMKKSQIFVRTYADMLASVQRLHGEFVRRYEELRRRGQ